MVHKSHIAFFTFLGYEVRDLYAGDIPYMETEVSYWTIPAKVTGQNISLCYSTPYVGGSDVLQGYSTYSQRIYQDLPPHNIIYFSIFMVLIDSWDATDSITLQFGSNQVSTQNFIAGATAFFTPACGWTGRLGTSLRLLGRVFHDSSVLDFRLISYLNGPSNQKSFGFRDIYLNFANKSPTQTEFICGDTPSTLLTNKCQCPLGQYSDANGDRQVCHPDCAWCFGPDSSDCFTCASGTFFDGTNCVICSTACPVCHTMTSDDCNYCAVGYFLVGHSCIATCDPPLIHNSPLATCTYPCQQNGYLFPDSSCSASCPSPLVPFILYKTKKFCKSDCGNDYAYFDSYCDTQCTFPFTPKTHNSLKICQPPVCGPRPCTFCNTNNDCSTYHSCMMTSIGRGLCMSYIKYQLDSDILRSTMNGYIITVNVAPTLDLVEGPNDILNVEIANLIVNKDYTILIEKQSKGVFLVTVLIKHAIPLKTIPVKFTYSPEVIKLESNLPLPQIVYISPQLEKAADTIEAASVVAFGLMIINTVGFVMSGGLATIWSFLPENQYTYYLLYLNVNYLYHTKAYFKSLANFDMLLDIFPDNDEDDTNNDQETQTAEDVQRSLPARFVEEDYSPNFQDNAGQVLITLAAIAMTIAVVTVLFKLLALPRRSYFAHRILKTVRRIIRWNGIIRQLLSYSLAISLASFIQFHVKLFERDRYIFYTLLSALALVLVIIGFKVMASLIENIPKSRFERIVYSEWYGTLWEDLNLNIKKTRYYYWIVSLRGVLLSYVAVFFDPFPLLQIGVLIIYQCYILTLFLKGCRIQAVFETNSLNIVTFAEEILLLIMKTIIMACYILSKYITDNDTLVLMGWAVIAPGLLMQVMQCIYSTIIQLIELMKLLKKLGWKVKRFLYKGKVVQKIRRIQRVQRVQMNSGVN